MADSIRERILQAVVAALQVDSIVLPGGALLAKPAGLTVHRFRHIPLERDELPSAVVYLGSEPVGRETAAPPIVEREMIFRVELRSEGEPSDRVLDPYVTWVVAALQADPTLGGLVRKLEERRTEWGGMPEETDLPLGAAGVAFSAHYRTKYGDPTAAPLS